MWIVMNDAFVSIVENPKDPETLAVRARVREDLENIFPEFKNEIIESEDTDYRFRLYVDRYYVAARIRNTIEEISYTNFKDSVVEKWRKKAYTEIWFIMHDIQEWLTPSSNPWWLNYKLTQKK